MYASRIKLTSETSGTYMQEKKKYLTSSVFPDGDVLKQSLVIFHAKELKLVSQKSARTGNFDALQI